VAIFLDNNGYWRLGTNMKEKCDLCSNNSITVLILNIPPETGIKQLITYRCSKHKNTNYEVAVKMVDMKLEGLHKKSINNKSNIDSETLCGCFYCETIFLGDKVSNYIDEGQTALCPICNVDSVIASDKKEIVNQSILKAMHSKYFK
jgi:hypothetical protein